MKKLFLLSACVVLLVVTSAFSLHKFYVAIYQINYSQDKKMLQVTSRIFVDDLNDALLKKYAVKTHLGEKEETPADVELMKKYITENFSISVNGKTRPMVYHSKEMENNVLICYFSSRDVSKITSLEIRNKILFDFVTEQRNIIQTTVNGKKSSLLLTADQPSGKLDF